MTVVRCFLEMGFPINYLLQLLQSFLPVHGLEGKCSFPIVLFKVCQKQQQSLKPAPADNNNNINNNNNSSMDNTGNSHPTYVLPWLESLNYL